MTVQELSYNLMLIFCSLPILLTLHLGVSIVAVTVAGIALILVILTLHRPDVLALSFLDLARAAAAIALFWLVVQGLSPGRIDLFDAALIFTLSSLSGAVTVIPGGVGANEASVTGLLVVFGVAAAPAAGAALINRFLISVLALLLGICAYLLVRRRFNLGSIFQLAAQRRGEPRKQAAAPE